MMLLTLVAALAQPLPVAATTLPASPQAMLGDAPVVCNPDMTKGLACHMNKVHAQTRAYHAKRQAAAAAACDPKAGNTRGCARLSAQETRNQPVAD